MSIAINALNNIKNGNLGFDKVKSGYSILSIRDIIKLFINGGWTVEAVQRGGREAREFARNMLATICYSVVAHGYDSAKLPSEGIEVYVNKTDNFSIRIEKDDKNIPRFVYYNIKIETNPLNKEEIIILLDNPPKIVLSEAIPDNFQQLCENAIEQSLSTNPGEYRCLVFNALKDAKLNLITKMKNPNLLVKSSVKTNSSTSENQDNTNDMVHYKSDDDLENNLNRTLVNATGDSLSQKSINAIISYITKKVKSSEEVVAARAEAEAAAVKIQYLFRKHKKLLEGTTADQNQGGFKHIYYEKDTPDQATYALLIQDGHIRESIKLPTEEVPGIEGGYKRLDKKGDHGVTLIDKQKGRREPTPYTSLELVRIIGDVNKANKLGWKKDNNNEIDTIAITHDYGTKDELGYYLARNAGDNNFYKMCCFKSYPKDVSKDDYRMAFGKVARDVGLLCESGYFAVDFKPNNLQDKRFKIPNSTNKKSYNKVKLFLIDTNSICSVEKPSYAATVLYSNQHINKKWESVKTRNKDNGQVKVDFAIAMSLLEFEGVDLYGLIENNNYGHKGQIFELPIGNKGMDPNDPILKLVLDRHIKYEYKDAFKKLVCSPNEYLENLETNKPAKVTGVYKMFKPTSPYYYHDHANNNNDQANNNSNEPSQSLHIKA